MIGRWLTHTWDSLSGVCTGHTRSSSRVRDKAVEHDSHAEQGDGGADQRQESLQGTSRLVQPAQLEIAVHQQCIRYRTASATSVRRSPSRTKPDRGLTPV
jgi:DNA-binding MurR/RpiR family transcriptional regulator